MSSRTTEWRRRKLGNPTDGRGRHLESERGERLAFVGAVAAQLLAQGFATHSGLKVYGRRVPTAKEREIKASLSLAMTAGKSPKRLLSSLAKESLKATCGDACPVWVSPPGQVWKAIESAPFNADCLALGAAFVGKLVYETRNARLRGVGHSALTARRKPSFDKYWKAIEGMSRQTASYWQSARKSEYRDALQWLARMLMTHGLEELPEMRADLATVLRDDLGDALAGRALKAPSTDCQAPLLSRKLRKNSFATSNNSDR